MNDEQRRLASHACQVVRESVLDLKMDLNSMSDEIVQAQWEQLQDDMAELAGRMAE